MAKYIKTWTEFKSSAFYFQYELVSCVHVTFNFLIMQNMPEEAALVRGQLSLVIDFCAFKFCFVLIPLLLVVEDSCSQVQQCSVAPRLLLIQVHTSIYELLHYDGVDQGILGSSDEHDTFEVVVWDMAGKGSSSMGFRHIITGP